MITLQLANKAESNNVLIHLCNNCRCYIYCLKSMDTVSEWLILKFATTKVLLQVG